MKLPRGFRGLHARFSLLVAATLLLMLAVVGVMLQRQAGVQQEVVAVSRDSMRSLVGDHFLTDVFLQDLDRACPDLRVERIDAGHWGIVTHADEVAVLVR